MRQHTFDPNTAKVQLVTDAHTALDFIEWLDRDRPLMGVDVETSGLDWFDGVLRLVQFGDETEGWAIPYERFPQLVVQALQILDKRLTPLVGHNFKFDMHWLERNTGWTFDTTTWNRFHDTMLLAAVLNSSGTKALKDLAEFYVHPVAKVGQQALKADMKKGGWGWHDVPVDLPSYWGYGVLDTILTVNLFWILHDKAAKADCLRAYEVERGATPGLYTMERKGMLIDSEHCVAQQDKLIKRCDEIEAYAHKEFGLTNIRSGPQIAQCLLSRNVPLVATTPSNGWCMDADALTEIVERTKDPLAAVIAEYRHGLKMAGSYYGNFLRYQRSDGRVHPMYRQIQARTGRMSATEPAVQTLPRPEDAHGAANEVRNAFIAPEGHVLISTDFTNVEARIFAHFAQEQGMIQAIRDGVDLHGYTAMQMYKLAEIAAKSDPRRQVAKGTLFTLLFGGGAAKVAQTAGISYEDAVEALARIHAAFPGIKRFQRTTSQQAQENLEQHGQAFMRGVDGRILALQEDDTRFYAFTNYCLPLDTEVLSNRGWLTHDQLVVGDQVMGYSDGVLNWTAVSKVHHTSSPLVELRHQMFTVRCTPDHRWLTTSRSGVEEYSAATAIKPGSRLKISAPSVASSPTRNVSDGDVFLAAWVVTDGNLTWTGNCPIMTISQKLGAKHDALVSALESYGFSYKYGKANQSEDVMSFRFPVSVTRPFLVRLGVESGQSIKPHLTSLVLAMTPEQRSIFIDAGFAAEGSIDARGHRTFAQSITMNRDVLEAFQLASFLQGNHGFYSVSQRGQATLRLDGRHAVKKHFADKGLRLVALDGEHDVFCLTTESGNFVARQGDRVFITGNCIQGTATIILKQRLAVIDAMGLREYCVAAIHDEIVAEVPAEDEADFAVAIAEAMNDNETYSVPITAEPGKGAVRLGDAK